MKDTLLALTDKQCPVDELLKHVKGHKCLDCGKCVFGYEGATQLSMILEDITAKKARSTDIQQMISLAELMRTQSMCEDGSELAGDVLAVLEKYADEFALHAAKKGCTAGVCRRFMSYHILPAECVGCGDCLDVCEDDAILGKAKFIHVIVQNECTQCGKCLEACEEGAVVVAGAEKPKCPPRPIPCRKK